MDLLIVHYQLMWNVSTGTGDIWLYPETPPPYNISVKSIADADHYMNILRSETPVYYNTVSTHLHTGQEPVGEGES